MTALGMDVDGVRQLANHLSQKADEIRTLTNGLNTAIHGVHWTGPDHDRFVDEWNSQHMSQLRQVADVLEQAATAANHNAAQQESASGS